MVANEIIDGHSKLVANLPVLLRAWDSTLDISPWLFIIDRLCVIEAAEMKRVFSSRM